MQLAEKYTPFFFPFNIILNVIQKYTLLPYAHTKYGYSYNVNKKDSSTETKLYQNHRNDIINNI